MYTCELPVKVVVDTDTGTWSVDDQPMILQPRHAWVGAHREFERAFGLNAYRDALYNATYQAARIWCEREAKTFGIVGVELFEHYVKRMGQRGFAQITIERFEPEQVFAELRVEHSVYVAEYGPRTGRKTCYMFEGAFSAGIEAAFDSLGYKVKCQATEVQCGAEGADHCMFQVTRR